MYILYGRECLPTQFKLQYSHENKYDNLFTFAFEFHECAHNNLNFLLAEWVREGGGREGSKELMNESWHWLKGQNKTSQKIEDCAKED